MGAALAPVETGKGKPAPRLGVGSEIHAHLGQSIVALLFAHPLAHQRGIVQHDPHLPGQMVVVGAGMAQMAGRGGFERRHLE